MNNNHEPFSDENQKHVSYSFKVGENIFRRIDKNLLMSKHLNHDFVSKQQWIIDAIKEKLKKEAYRQDSIPQERQLTVKIKTGLNRSLDEKIDIIRKFRKSYSKKQWILEAVLDKLDQEEEINKKRLQEIMND